MNEAGALPMDAATSSFERHVVEWRVESSLALLADHFPGRPLVPGYYQLARVRVLVSEWLGVVPARVSMKSVKFLHPIEPEQVVVITLERKPGKNAVSVVLSVGDRVVTQGDLVIE